MDPLYENQYQASVGLWKAFLQFCVVFFGVGATLLVTAVPETWEGFQEGWPALAFAFLAAAGRFLNNYRKQHGFALPWQSKFWIVALCVGFVLGGCATMKSVTINEDGSSHSTKVVVPPMSKQKLADFKYNAEINAEGDWKQSIGSMGVDVDTTPQAEVAVAVSAAVGAAVGAAIEASTAPTPLVQALPHVPDIIDSLPLKAGER